MSASQRAKGAAGEREAAKLLAALYPGADRNPMQARGAHRDGCDVEGTPWYVEVKSHAKPAPIAALTQAVEDRDDAGDPRPALVLAKTTRRGWTVTMAYEDFARLVSEGQAARETLRALCKKLRCSRAGCHMEPIAPEAWCVLHMPYDETKRDAGVFRTAAPSRLHEDFVTREASR